MIVASTGVPSPRRRECADRIRRHSMRTGHFGSLVALPDGRALLLTVASGKLPRQADHSFVDWG